MGLLTAGLSTLGIGGLVGGYVWAAVEGWAPSPAQLRCHVMRRLQRSAPTQKPKFKILLAWLDNDRSGQQTRHVAAVFHSTDGLEVDGLCQCLRIAAHGSQDRAKAEAARRGRDLLERHGADLLVWGEVAKADEVLRLWFLGRQDGAASTGKSYRLDTETILPIGFGADLGAQIVATALAQVAPATERAGTYLVALLEPIAAKLGPLLADPPASLSAEQIAALHHAHGTAAYTVGEQKGDQAYLEQAVAAHHAALEERRRERVPLDWASTQNNLGNALTRLGERTGDADLVRRAIAAQQDAREVLQRLDAPAYIAMAEETLALSRQILAALEAEEGRAQR